MTLSDRGDRPALGQDDHRVRRQAKREPRRPELQAVSLLLDVVHEWVGILNDEAASAKMAEVKSNLGQTWFAWSGETKNGGLAYYRIQGPTVVIEYAPQQGDLDHIHTIYRDPTNDYGAKLVAR